jgi:transcriptional regulator with XRE-family HTH domain
MPQYRDKKLLDKIAMKVRQLRTEKGITLEAFNEDTNINLSRIEYGKANITISTLKVICRYFDLSMEEFFKMIDE